MEIEGLGDLAYDRGTYSQTVTPDGAAPIEDRGKYLTILRKQAAHRSLPKSNCRNRQRHERHRRWTTARSAIDACSGEPAEVTDNRADSIPAQEPGRC